MLLNKFDKTIKENTFKKHVSFLQKNYCIISYEPMSFSVQHME